MKKWDEMTARERDARVQEKVFGNRIDKDYWGQLKYAVHDATFDIPEYTTNLSAAWEVVEKMRESDRRGVFYERFHARVSSIFEVTPEAICLAALRAVGVTV